jgi:hypothetical protein
LDIPEVDAKKDPGGRSFNSANAQYNMAVNGATDSQPTEAKKKRTERTYEFAQNQSND